VPTERWHVERTVAAGLSDFFSENAGSKIDATFLLNVDEK
jgi:hypothetical protein